MSEATDPKVTGSNPVGRAEGWAQTEGVLRRAYTPSVASEPILDRIDALVEEEHRLWNQSEQGRLDEAEHGRLGEIRGELDRCWDLLRRRRANPDAPDVPPQVPDPPNELEGPDPEPLHLEHGVHPNEPAPDPDVPRDIP
jgi:uncharacterized protein DUF2630